jgi:hypothetical protein
MHFEYKFGVSKCYEESTGKSILLNRRQAQSHKTKMLEFSINRVPEIDIRGDSQTGQKNENSPI